MNQELKKSVFSEYRELSPKRLIFERIYEERYSESKHYSGDSKHYSSNSTSNSNYGTVLPKLFLGMKYGVTQASP